MKNFFNLLILLVLILNIILIHDFVRCTEEKTESDTFLEDIKVLLQSICEKISKSNWEKHKSLKECYSSSIYINEYLWLISSFIVAQELNKEFNSIMVLPNHANINECTKLNEKQCITKVNIKKENNKISIDYNNINEIISPIINECKVTNPHIRSSLNILWLESNSKLSEISKYQSLLVGKGYTELMEFEDLFDDLSTLICSDIKKYIYSDKYRSEIRNTILNIINNGQNNDHIQDPIYVRIPMKYDFGTEIDESLCREIKDKIPILDKYSRVELFIEKNDKYVILNNIDNIKIECEPNENKRVVTWRIY
ncbi:hypothetical protein FG379_002851 [Cryptosporidium bovis]|uniref:uncharacterized protein n=1 Tax=Cryptosporidium bovis TaxID=310047 RepID=UPI00351A21D7|nr:hypothetical protein FG379_002851 [Cryptosporidium bovis]